MKRAPWETGGGEPGSAVMVRFWRQSQVVERGRERKEPAWGEVSLVLFGEWREGGTGDGDGVGFGGGWSGGEGCETAGYVEGFVGDCCWRRLVGREGGKGGTDIGGRLGGRSWQWGLVVRLLRR